MKLNFSFNPDIYNLWEIYEIISEFYPIGIKRNSKNGIYYNYKGIKKIEKLIKENIHDKENFQNRWVNFSEEIGKDLNKKNIGRTHGQAPSFSSSLIIDEKRLENCIHTKELHYSISLIGKFYQIYGIDRTRILEENESKGYSSVNVITTSPYEEYKKSFEIVENKINDKYIDYRIIPFGFGQTIIKGLQVNYLDDENCSINMALFNQYLNEENILKSRRGDRNYGKENWLK